MKVYPVLNQFVKANGYKDGAIMEIYDVLNHKTICRQDIYRIQIAFRKVISYFVSFVSSWRSLWNSYYTKSTKFIHKVSQRKKRKPE